jgi:hypothetical protein
LGPSLAAALRQAHSLLAYLSPDWRALSSFVAEIGAATPATDVVGRGGPIVPVITKSAQPGRP